MREDYDAVSIVSKTKRQCDICSNLSRYSYTLILLRTTHGAKAEAEPKHKQYQCLPKPSLATTFQSPAESRPSKLRMEEITQPRRREVNLRYADPTSSTAQRSGARARSGKTSMVTMNGRRTAPDVSKTGGVQRREGGRYKVETLGGNDDMTL